jgi:transcriptional regulator with XRE-family HTH domain
MTANSAEQTAHPLDEALGMLIAERRKLRGISQAELGATIGVSFQQVQKYERGSNRVSFSRLITLAHALDCRAVDLVGDLDDPASLRPVRKQEPSHLALPGARDLISAYGSLPKGLRRTILNLAQEIARNSSGSTDA